MGAGDADAVQPGSRRTVIPATLPGVGLHIANHVPRNADAGAGVENAGCQGAGTRDVLSEE